MAWTVFRHQLVFGPRQGTVAGQPVEFGAKIARRTGSCQVRQFFFRRYGLLDDHGAGGIHAAIQIYGSEYSFEGIDQKTLLGSAAGSLFAMTEAQVRAEIQAMGGG